AVSLSLALSLHDALPIFRPRRLHRTSDSRAVDLPARPWPAPVHLHAGRLLQPRRPHPHLHAGGAGFPEPRVLRAGTGPTIRTDDRDCLREPPPELVPARVKL